MSFLSRSGFYKKEKWYCYHCKDVTKVELNEEWIKVGKPYSWEDDVYNFDWYARCEICKTHHYSGLECICDDCGYNDFPDEDYYVENDKIFIIEDEIEEQKLKKRNIKIYPIIQNNKYNNWKAMEFGGNPYDWDETHFCPFCKKEFIIENSNC